MSAVAAAAAAAAGAGNGAAKSFGFLRCQTSFFAACSRRGASSYINGSKQPAGPSLLPPIKGCQPQTRQHARPSKWNKAESIQSPASFLQKSAATNHLLIRAAIFGLSAYYVLLITKNLHCFFGLIFNPFISFRRALLLRRRLGIDKKGAEGRKRNSAAAASADTALNLHSPRDRSTAEGQCSHRTAATSYITRWKQVTVFEVLHFLNLAEKGGEKQLVVVGQQLTLPMVKNPQLTDILQLKIL